NRQREYEEYRQMRARNEEVLLKMLEIQSRGALAAMERQVRVIESEAFQQPTLPPAQMQQTETEEVPPVKAAPSWHLLTNQQAWRSPHGHQART
ncbi:hypothetical protein, partial [Thermogemmatispora onikobensis]